MSKKKLSSFDDWINTYFQSFICLQQYEHFLASIFCKISLALLNRIHWSWKDLKKTLHSHENIWSLTDLNGANIVFRSDSRDWLFSWCQKINPLMNKSVLLLQLLVDYMLIECYLQKWVLGLQVLHSFLSKGSTWYVHLKVLARCVKQHSLSS